MALSPSTAVTGALALALLASWPGLTVVKAPWPFVPFLSLSYWAVSWGFLSAGGAGRRQFLLASLTFFACLSLLRVFQPWEGRWPKWPAALVFAVCVGRLLPFFFWLVAPGLGAAFPSATTLLLVWRDGIPGSYAPLHAISGFGADAVGLPALAADVALLAGLPAPRAFVLASLLGESLLVLGLFALGRCFLAEGVAAVGGVAAVALGAAVVPSSEGATGATLAVAFVAAGSALVLRGSGRSAAIAAGGLWATALAAQPVTAGLGWVLVTAFVLWRHDASSRELLGLATALAVLLAIPFLRRTVGLWPGTWPGVDVAAGLHAATAALAFLACVWVARRQTAPRPALVAICALAAGATAVDWTLRTAGASVGRDGQQAAAWLAAHSRPLDRVCPDEPAARAWLPALAGRPVDSATPCRFLYVTGPASAAPGAVFRQGVVAVYLASNESVAPRP